MDPITIGNIAIASLLFVSELLPFIRSNDYNGILDLVVKFLGKLRHPMGAASDESVADDTVVIEE